MTPKLTPLQNELNKLLKDKGYFTYKYDDYIKDEKAKKLLELFSKKDDDWSNDISFKMYLIQLDDRKKENFKSYDELESVKELFQIFHNDTLLTDISDSYYSLNYSIDVGTGKYTCDSRLKTKIGA